MMPVQGNPADQARGRGTGILAQGEGAQGKKRARSPEEEEDFGSFGADVPPEASDDPGYHISAEGQHILAEGYYRLIKGN